MTSKRARAARLKKQVEACFRQELSAYGLPLDEYTAAIELGKACDDTDVIEAWIVFTRKGTGAKICSDSALFDSVTGEMLERFPFELM